MISGEEFINAASNNKLYIINQYIREGGYIDHKVDGRTALYKAVIYGNLEIVKLLIAAGANVNSTNGIFNTSPLMGASMCGNIDCIEYLIEAGANLEQEDIDGETALIRGIQHFDVVKILVDAGADMNHKDKRGVSAFNKAVGACLEYMQSHQQPKYEYTTRDRLIVVI